MVRAVEKVRERLLRASSALAEEGVDYAVAGGNAVAAWVSTVDEAAIRNTRDVDILIRRQDLERARLALEAKGFVYRRVAGIDMFLDSETASPRDAVHLVFANEMVREGELMPNPDVTESHSAEHFQILSLDALVRIKLTAFRDKDRTHLRDLIEIGLIDESWLSRVPPQLSHRLKALLDDPEG